MRRRNAEMLELRKQRKDSSSPHSPVSDKSKAQKETYRHIKQPLMSSETHSQSPIFCWPWTNLNKLFLIQWIHVILFEVFIPFMKKWNSFKVLGLRHKNKNHFESIAFKIHCLWLHACLNYFAFLGDFFSSWECN